MRSFINYYLIIVRLKNSKFMKNFKIYTLSLILVLALFSSCKKDTPEPENEEEVITTLIYTLTPEAGGNSVVFSFRDLDGDGGDAPVVINGVLAANTVYDTEIELLNEAENPTEDITEEVEAEGDEHQIFYAQTADLDMAFAYVDLDGDGNPIGLMTKLETGAASTGMYRITLRHEPSKSANGVSNGDITNAGGSTDIEVTFDVEIQ